MKIDAGFKARLEFVIEQVAKTFHMAVITKLALS
jgi:hypothetical protein